MPNVSVSKTELRISFFLKVATFLILCKFKKIHLMPICFHRSDEDQLKRYRQGRTPESIKLGQKIVTYRDGYTKRSEHQDWKAMDFVLVIFGELIWVAHLKYDTAGKIWKRLGGRWGGDFKKPNGQPMGDYGHFEI